MKKKSKPSSNMDSNKRDVCISLMVCFIPADAPENMLSQDELRKILHYLTKLADRAESTLPKILVFEGVADLLDSKIISAIEIWNQMCQTILQVIDQHKDEFKTLKDYNDLNRIFEEAVRVKLVNSLVEMLSLLKS